MLYYLTNRKPHGQNNLFSFNDHFNLPSVSTRKTRSLPHEKGKFGCKPKSRFLNITDKIFTWIAWNFIPVGIKNRLELWLLYYAKLTSLKRNNVSLRIRGKQNIILDVFLKLALDVKFIAAVSRCEAKSQTGDMRCSLWDVQDDLSIIYLSHCV